MFELLGLRRPRAWIISSATRRRSREGRSVTALRADTLCVPSGQDGAPIPSLDHLKCYKARTTKGTPPFQPRTVTLADQFQAGTATVAGPSTICTAVDKNGEGILDDSARLTCYRLTKLDPKSAPHTLAVETQFGTTTLALGVPRSICVPPPRVAPTPTPTTITLPTATATPTPASTPTPTSCPAPLIATVDPLTGPVGTEVTITGSNLDCGGPATVQLSCGGRSMIVTSLSATTIKSIIPIGAPDCIVSLTTPGGTGSAPPVMGFDVVLSRDFSLAVIPAAGTVIQGSATTHRVSAVGPNGFADLITLGVTGLPVGISASFSPATITAGQSAQLIVRAATSAPVGVGPFGITGMARIDAADVQHSTSANLTVIDKGQTTLVGRVLDTDGLPIKGVAIRSGAELASTDDNGNFLLSDPPVGNQVVLVDGGPASTPDTHYPTIPAGLTIVAGATNELPYVPHLHVQKNFNFTAITPAQDTIATDPDMPDVALRIPAGTQIVGWDGQPNQKVSMRTVPVGSLPVRPLPPEVNTKTVYMFYCNRLAL